MRRRVRIAALDPFTGYKSAIDDKLEDATAVLDAFHRPGQHRPPLTLNPNQPPEPQKETE